MKRGISLIIVAVLSSLVTLSGYIFFIDNGNKEIIVQQKIPVYSDQAKFAKYESKADLSNLSFNYAAEVALPNVVHIKSISRAVTSNQVYDLHDLFRDFFGEQYRQSPREETREGVGSGVIVSSDGYVVTNNHVVEGASEIEVVLNDKSNFVAQVIGTDPSTDLALLKIDAQDLSYMEFSKSENVGVGDWVLAVGNPFNLSSTVTAGIVSAKGRNINILRDKFAVESFIQTDAAVNPGNSGGALVNMHGELVGINTAIASPTGAFAGYSFAIPSDLVSKVIQDLKEYGVVQRALLGVQIDEMNGELAKEMDVDITEGVVVRKVVEGSAAEDAGIKEDDIIVKIDNYDVKTFPELLEAVASHRPGDKVNVTLIRKGKEKNIDVTLKNKEGNLNIVTRKSSVISNLGIEVTEIDDKDILRKLDIEGGVGVKSLNHGKIKTQTNMREGFIITKINGEDVDSVEDVEKILDGYEGGVMIEGVYPNYEGKYYYAFGM